MILTPHFTLEELTITQHRGIDNTPPPEIVERLKALAEHLERVRVILAKPMIVSSGYRSPKLNRAVGGTLRSAHIHGYAADFICPAFGRPIDVCRALLHAGLKFDQLIEEGTWVHVSFDPQMRQEVLTKNGHGYSYGLAA